MRGSSAFNDFYDLTFHIICGGRLYLVEVLCPGHGDADIGKLGEQNVSDPMSSLNPAYCDRDTC